MREWRSSPLGELVTFQKGRKVDVSDFPRVGYAPYLGAGVLAGEAATEFADTTGGVLANHSDVLMLWDGERSGLASTGMTGVVSSTVARLVPKACVIPTLLSYLLNERFDWIQARRTGTGVPHVPKDLGRILVLRYPAEEREQRRIAEILSTVDEAIEQTEALIAKTQAIKAGLMHDLFTRGVLPNGQLRPPREQAPELYKPSPLGWMPVGWEAQSLQSMCQFEITYGIVQAGPHVERGIPYIRTGDMAGNRLDVSSMLRTTSRIAGAYKRSEVRCGEIVCAIRATIGKVLPIPRELDGANLTQGTARISPNRHIDAGFLLWCLRTDRVQREIQARVKGTTFGEITLADLRDVLIGAPIDRNEQESLARLMEDCELREQSEELELVKLRDMRSGLMHDLLTGRVRVPVETATQLRAASPEPDAVLPARDQTEPAHAGP